MVNPYKNSFLSNCINFSQVADDDDARDAVLELKQSCSNKLEWLKTNPELPTQTCRKILDEIKKMEEATEVLRREGRERKEWLKRMQSFVSGAREVSLGHSKRGRGEALLLGVREGSGMSITSRNEFRCLVESRYLAARIA